MPGPAGVAAMRQIEAEVLALLRRVRRTSAENARLVHPELSAAAYAVLLFVVEHEPTRATDVVEQLDMDKGAVSRQVSQLEQLGLVSRASDPDDGRAYRLVLSDLGRDRIAVLRRHRRADLEGRLSTWSEHDLAVFADRLARYNASFEG